MDHETARNSLNTVRMKYECSHVPEIRIGNPRFSTNDITNYVDFVNDASMYLIIPLTRQLPN